MPGPVAAFNPAILATGRQTWPKAWRDPETAAYARVRGFELLPPPPPPPPPRRSRFDPRPAPDPHTARVVSLPQRISTDPKVSQGRPVIRGTRVRAIDVLSLLVAGADEAEILADHPDLTSDDIKACLTYATAKVDPSIAATLSAPHTGSGQR